MSHAWPLADGDRLWLFSYDRYCVISSDRGTDLKVRGPRELTVAASLECPTRPFLYDGRPAVIDFRLRGPFLRTLEKEGWTEVGPVDLTPPLGLEGLRSVRLAHPGRRQDDAPPGAVWA